MFNFKRWLSTIQKRRIINMIKYGEISREDAAVLSIVPILYEKAEKISKLVRENIIFKVGSSERKFSNGTISFDGTWKSLDGECSIQCSTEGIFEAFYYEMLWENGLCKNRNPYLHSFRCFIKEVQEIAEEKTGK